MAREQVDVEGLMIAPGPAIQVPDRRLSMYILEGAVGDVLEDDPAYLRCGIGQYRMLMTIYAGDKPKFPRKQFRLSFGLELCAVWDKSVPPGTIIVENLEHERVATIENLEEP